MSLKLETCIIISTVLTLIPQYNELTTVRKVYITCADPATISVGVELGPGADSPSIIAREGGPASVGIRKARKANFQRNWPRSPLQHMGML